MSYNSDLQKNNAELQAILDEVNNLPNAGAGENENGATFTPAVSADGVISWTNDKGLDNPEPVNIKGADGKTPEKGVDYDTPEDRAEIEAYIATELAKRGQLKPEFANDISECTDTTKLYVLPDGHIWAYIKKEVPEVTVPNFTNQIEKVGYEANVRLSSDGTTTGGSGYGTTGYIQIPAVASGAAGQAVLYLQNIEALATDANVRICYYDSSKTFKRVTKASDGIVGTNEYGLGYWVGEDGYISKFDMSGQINALGGANGSWAYIRFCATGLDEESIVTINEPIEYITSGGESVNGWTDTGLTIVPVSAELEDRVRQEETKSDYFLREIAIIKEQIAEDEEIIVSDGIPDYIVTEAKRVANAVQSNRTAKSLVFPALSDMHIFDGNSNHESSLISAQYAGMGIKELQKRIHLDFTAYLGDYTWGTADHTVAQVKADITAFKETTDTTGAEIWCVGNHDLNYGANRDRLLTLDEVYGYIGANSDGTKPYANIERCYGYIDFDNQKIRVIYLNTCDASDWDIAEGTAARSEWISPTQIQWLADTALNFTGKSVPNEWGIVIVGHHPLHYGFSCFDTVMQLLEAYKNGSNGSLSCTIKTETVNGTTTYPQQRVDYDFINTERAEIICNIHGHNHNCGYSQISSSTRTGSTAVAPWLWRLCIPNICANRYNTGADVGKLYGEYDENGNPVYHAKEAGTEKATSFCVVNIDRKNRKIYAHIFGAGVDREISY